MIEIGSRARKLPAPPPIVWWSLVEPHGRGARPWLNLLTDEVEPRVLQADEPHHVVWSSLWSSRPKDELHLELTEASGETLLRCTLVHGADRMDGDAYGAAAAMVRARVRTLDVDEPLPFRFQNRGDYDDDLVLRPHLASRRSGLTVHYVHSDESE